MTELEKIAAEFDCLTEAQYLEISGYTPGTAAAMRKRRQGPPFVRLGKAYFYPKRGLMVFMEGRTQFCGKPRTNQKPVTQRTTDADPRP